jgi:NAD(P)-dependent dehydrogenase (short-subunit alcohol dehydrogenase family)
VGTLEGKIALVTGGGTGIGKGIATLFAQEGARVIISGRRERPLRDTAALYPERISWVAMDLANRADRARALETVVCRYERLDILVNNAATMHIGAFGDLSEQQITELISTNLLGTALLIRQAMPMLKLSKGNIVNISSTSARHVPVPALGLAAYGAAKAGLNYLTRELAVELGPSGVRVNAVAPGFTRSEAMEHTLKAHPELGEAQSAQTALGRIGEPIDIARAVLFLASEQAAWVTAEILDASGGYFIAG